MNITLDLINKCKSSRACFSMRKIPFFNSHMRLWIFTWSMSCGIRLWLTLLCSREHMTSINHRKRVRYETLLGFRVHRRNLCFFFQWNSSWKFLFRFHKTSESALRVWAGDENKVYLDVKMCNTVEMLVVEKCEKVSESVLMDEVLYTSN